MKKKIMVITGTRADYGILHPILLALKNSNEFELLILVTGMHLSPMHGHTIDQIISDGFEVTDCVDILLHNPTHGNMAKSIGIGILGMTQAFEKSQPDIVVVLGDRGEMLAAAIAAAHLNIPVAHLHGGEVSGSIDESVRHAISKFAHIHLTSTKKSAERLIKMGEDPWRVSVVGAPRVETIVKSDIPSLKEVLNRYDISLTKKDYYLLIYHPVSNEYCDLEKQIEYIFTVLQKGEKDIICISPNSDVGNDRIRKAYMSFRNIDSVHFVESFAPLDYLVVLKECYALVGNSSSGIIEAATFKKPVINIGSRQNGRERSGNVIDVNATIEELNKGIEYLESNHFQELLKSVPNIYGKGNTSQLVLDIFGEMEIDGKLLQKKITY
ncbi:UDP-N-acetylglucosamine 2-epimerase [Peribacillus asahii]|uniref:UDP-N-acetylglucosamine 2-epimerase n=1 Tax=Peribacillus asahii TaxID=228899 RepID=UPI00381922C6